MPNERKKSTGRKPKNVTVLQTVPKKRKQWQNTKTSDTRADFLRAYEQTLGNISASCELSGINRRTFYRWLKSPARINVKFRQQLELLQPEEKLLDFAEGALMQQIRKGDTTAIIFALKTKGKHRGYVEKQPQVTVNIGDPLSTAQELARILVEEMHWTKEKAIKKVALDHKIPEAQLLETIA